MARFKNPIPTKKSVHRLKHEHLVLEEEEGEEAGGAEGIDRGAETNERWRRRGDDGGGDADAASDEVWMLSSFIAHGSPPRSDQTQTLPSVLVFTCCEFAGDSGSGGCLQPT